MAEKIVLAYSGGLDTSVAVRWLKEEGGYEVIALTVDVGMQRQREDVQSRALAAGAADISFMGALPFVIARARTGAEILLAEIYRGKPYYAGAVFGADESEATGARWVTVNAYLGGDGLAVPGADEQIALGDLLPAGDEHLLHLGGDGEAHLCVEAGVGEDADSAEAFGPFGLAVRYPCIRIV